MQATLSLDNAAGVNATLEGQVTVQATRGVVAFRSVSIRGLGVFKLVASATTAGGVVFGATTREVRMCRISHGSNPGPIQVRLNSGVADRVGFFLSPQGGVAGEVWPQQPSVAITDAGQTLGSVAEVVTNSHTWQAAMWWTITSRRG